MKQPFIEPCVFLINSNAIGDIVASLPVIKHAIDTYYTEPESYRVYALEGLRDLFWFVPDYNFVGINKTASFVIDSNRFPVIRKLNLFESDRTCKAYTDLEKTKEVTIFRMDQYVIPLRMTLGQYASINLLNRVLTNSEYSYLQYPQIPLPDYIKEIQGFIPGKTVVIPCNYRSLNRSFIPAELKKICEYIRDKGYIPVFTGKKDDNKGQYPTKELQDFDYSVGIDLRDKTSLLELISLIRSSACVVGIDGGTVHLAGMTNVPIVAGYTMASPELRVPVRSNTVGWNTATITPDSECRFCQDTWQSDFNNFAYCYNESYACVKTLTADKFIHYLEVILT